MRRVNVGVIGAGFSARLHVEALRQVRGFDVNVAAVAGRRQSRAEEFARHHEIPRVCADYRHLLDDPSIDVVTICVPNSEHAAMAQDAAAAGKHVICEKPLTGYFPAPEPAPRTGSARDALERALASADAVLDAARRNGVGVMYAENWVYAPALSKAKSLLAAADGAILDIRAEESHSGSHAPASRRPETAGGGALLMLGAHPIGAALHLKDFEGRRRDGKPVTVRSVTADTGALWRSKAFVEGTGDWLVSDWGDVETWATAVLTFTDGAKAVICASFAMLGGVRNTIELYTTNAVIKANMTPNDGMVVYAPEPAVFGDEYLTEKVETKGGWNFTSPDEDWTRGYPQEMQDFIECAVEGRTPLSDGKLARDVVEVIYAGYLAAETGRRIELPTHQDPTHQERGAR